MMHLSIKQKLIAVGVISILALLFLGVTSYSTNQHIIAQSNRLNDIKQTAATNYQLRIDRLQILLSQFELLAKLPLEGPKPNVIETIEKTAEAMRSGMSELVEEAKPFVDSAKLKSAEREMSALLNIIENRIIPLARRDGDAFQLAEQLRNLDEHRFNLMGIFREINAGLDADFKASDAAMITSIEDANQITLIAAVVAFLLVAVLMFVVIRGISRRLQAITDTMTVMSSGKSTDVPYTKDNDEIGDIARTLEVFGSNAVDNARKTLALDSVTSNVMMADADYNIIYINPALMEFLKKREADIQKELPQFNMDTLIGSNIDIFHKNPAHQRGMLDKLSDTYKTSIFVGGQSFNLIASPVFDQDGNRIGTTVEWMDGLSEGIINTMNRSQAMIEFDPQGTIMKVNDNFLNIMGFQLEEIQGRHHSILADKDHVNSQEYKEFWEKLRQGEPQIGEYKFFGKNGKEVWISASYNPVHDLRGTVVRVVQTASDITHEMDRRREIALLSLVANETDNSVIITNADEEIEYVNPGFCKMTGYRFEEVKGRRPGDFLQGELTDKETKAQIRESLDKREPLYTEILNYTKNGKPYWVSLAINPIVDQAGNVERYVSIQANITETKELSAYYEGQISAINKAQAVVEFNLDGTITKANENFLSVMGYTHTEIVGKHHSMFVPKEDVSSSDYKQLWDSLARGIHQSGEFKRVNKAGEIIYLNASYNPINDANGNPVKVVEYATDVTAFAKSRRENEAGMKEVLSVLEGLANGNLTVKMDGEYEGPFASIKTSLNSTIDRLTSIVERIKACSQLVSSAASEISSGSSDLANRTQQQASSLEETAASMEQLTGTVRQNSENAKNANDMAIDARGVAENGGEVVKEAVQAMERIESSSQKISEIISVIDEIAFQTNLLALNAAVEAARAGEAGKGFAVVASEVRSLAGRSASASKEIKSLIVESGQQVKSGAELVNKAGTTLEEIVASVKNVADLIADIAQASQEQSSGIDEVSTAVAQMDEVTQQNAALVEENEASAGSLVEQSQELDGMMQFFKVDEQSEEDFIAMAQKARQGSSTGSNHANGQAGVVRAGQGSHQSNGASKPNGKAANGASAPAANQVAETSRTAATASAAQDFDSDWEEF